MAGEELEKIVNGFFKTDQATVTRAQGIAKVSRGAGKSALCRLHNVEIQDLASRWGVIPERDDV